MQSEKQYIDLYNETQGMIKQYSCDVLNKVRDKAFEDFKAQGFPTKKVDRYKYTDSKAVRTRLWIEFAAFENAYQSLRGL